MEKIIINTPGAHSEILVGENWQSVTRLLPENGVVIITDDNVRRLYGDRFPKVPLFTVPPGEGSKKLEVIESLAEKLLEAGIDRTGFVLAIGGGVVSDLAGFLASIYMRGIRCGYVSTSLLSQVDASTGGKNGVNLEGTKNMLGNIRQPEFVICDPAMLLSLPEVEYLSGLSELIKTAIIGDKDLFDLIERSHKEILNRNCDLLTVLIAKSVTFKASVVSEDEKETGLRRILNFGHTYGHAVEIQKSVK
ncbi:MAG: 3-dehydroquinate synthase, partial [Bacteroidetes bacterium]|nr:3-dehydroquinate synthase [Bacteroidota bacterium]